MSQLFLRKPTASPLSESGCLTDSVHSIQCDSMSKLKESEEKEETPQVGHRRGPRNDTREVSAKGSVHVTTVGSGGRKFHCMAHGGTTSDRPPETVGTLGARGAGLTRRARWDLNDRDPQGKEHGGQSPLQGQWVTKSGLWKGGRLADITRE